MRRSALSLLLTLAFACTAQAGTSADIYIGPEGTGAIVISNVPQDDSFGLLLKAPPEPVLPSGSRPVGDMPLEPLVAPKASLLDKARRYEPWVAQAAREAQVDARLLHAVVAAESAYNASAVSPKGAVGLMQLMPATARRYGVLNILDAQQNLAGGARYLADLLRLFGNDLQLALAAYNAGENAVLRHGSKVPPYAETVAYVPRVLGLYRQLSSVAL
jgi:hypothetical protein